MNKAHGDRLDSNGVKERLRSIHEKLVTLEDNTVNGVFNGNEINHHSLVDMVEVLLLSEGESITYYFDKWLKENTVINEVYCVDKGRKYELLGFFYDIMTMQEWKDKIVEGENLKEFKIEETKNEFDDGYSWNVSDDTLDYFGLENEHTIGIQFSGMENKWECAPYFIDFSNEGDSMYHYVDYVEEPAVYTTVRLHLAWKKKVVHLVIAVQPKQIGDD